MDAVAWFMAGGIAAMIGAVAGVLVGGWVSWLAAVACGVMLTAATKRLSALVGAAFVIAGVASRIASSVLWAICLVVASVGLLVFGALAAVSAWHWAVHRLAQRDATVLAGLDAIPTSRPDDQTTVRYEPNPARAPQSSSVRPATVPLPASQVERLVRLAERDTASFRAALGQLSAEQRQQVRQALSARRRRAADDAS